MPHVGKHTKTLDTWDLTQGLTIWLGTIQCSAYVPSNGLSKTSEGQPPEKEGEAGPY